MPYALHLLVFTVTGTSDRHLREENQVLREQLGGRTLCLTDTQRRRLAVRGKKLGRRVLRQVVASPPRDSDIQRYLASQGFVPDALVTLTGSEVPVRVPQPSFRPRGGRASRRLAGRAIRGSGARSHSAVGRLVILTVRSLVTDLQRPVGGGTAGVLQPDSRFNKHFFPDPCSCRLTGSETGTETGESGGRIQGVCWPPHVDGSIQWRFQE